MIQGFVADASLAIAWAAETQADARTHELRLAAMSGARIVVPVLWKWEVANSLFVLFRRRLMNRQQWESARTEVLKVPLIVDEDGPAFAFSTTSELAAALSLSVYDATYLELAQRHGLPLATRDGALNRAAKKCGVKTLL